MRPTAAECGTRDGPVRYASDVFMPDPVTLLELATILAITGVVAGLLAGLLGVGGGIVIVPVLFQMFALIDVPETIRMHLARSEEHTSELQSLMRISYAVFCL